MRFSLLKWFRCSFWSFLALLLNFRSFYPDLGFFGEVVETLVLRGERLIFSTREIDAKILNVANRPTVLVQFDVHNGLLRYLLLVLIRRLEKTTLLLRPLGMPLRVDNLIELL